MQDDKSHLLERANQMIWLCRNADQSADQTVITLADQREQLVGIEIHLTSMDVKLADTKHDIDRSKGLLERVMDSFRSRFHRRFVSKILHHARRNQHSIVSPRRRQMSSKPMESNSSEFNCVIDGQIDDAFCQIDHLIHTLKDKAYTINDQLVEQAGILDQIHDHMIESTDHVEEQTVDMKKIPLFK